MLYQLLPFKQLQTTVAVKTEIRHGLAGGAEQNRVILVISGIQIQDDDDHHHKHQGLDPLIRSVPKVTTTLSIVSSVFQLFSFLVIQSDPQCNLNKNSY